MADRDLRLTYDAGFDYSEDTPVPARRMSPGKRTLTSQLGRSPFVHRTADPGAVHGSSAMGYLAGEGTVATTLRRRHDNGTGFDAEQAVARAASSSAVELPAHHRLRLEHSLDTDLSTVRVHTGPDAETAAQAVGARAYTVGKDIYFGANQYDPTSAAGQHLLAHEVAHTVQQGTTGGMLQGKLEVSQPEDPAEVEADRFAVAVARGERVELSHMGTIGRVHRQSQPDGGALPGGTDGKAPPAEIPTSLPEKIEYLRSCLDSGGGAPGAVLAIWNSFGAEIDNVATSYPDLFDRSKGFLNGCGQMTVVGDQFATEVQARALKAVDRGAGVVEQERNFLQGKAADGKPVDPKARQRALENLQAKTKQLQAVQDALGRMGSLRVWSPDSVPTRANTGGGPGSSGVPFDPNRPLPDQPGGGNYESDDEPDEEINEAPDEESVTELLVSEAPDALPSPDNGATPDDAGAEDESALAARIHAESLPWAGVSVDDTASANDTCEEPSTVCELPEIEELPTLPPGLEDAAGADGPADFDAAKIYNWSELKAAWDILLEATDETRKSCPAAFALVKNDEGADFAKEKDSTKAMEQAIAQLDELLDTKIPKARDDIPSLWPQLRNYHQELLQTSYTSPFRFYAAQQAIEAAQPFDPTALQTVLDLIAMVPGPVGTAANLVSLGIDAAEAYASAKNAEALGNARDVGMDVDREDVEAANEAATNDIGGLLGIPIPEIPLPDEIKGRMEMAFKVNFTSLLNTTGLRGKGARGKGGKAHGAPKPRKPKLSRFTRAEHLKLKRLSKRLPKWYRDWMERTAKKYRLEWQAKAKAHILEHAEAGDKHAMAMREILEKKDGVIHHPLPVEMHDHALIEAAAGAKHVVLNDASLGIALPRLTVNSATMRKHGKSLLAKFPAHAEVPGHALYNKKVRGILDRKLARLAREEGGSGGPLMVLERLSETPKGRKKIIAAVDEAVAEAVSTVHNWKSDTGLDYLN